MTARTQRQTSVQKDPRGEVESGRSGNDRTAAILGQLQEGIDTILESEEFAAYLRMMSRFHSYSFGNVLLISRQFEEATQVAGYRRWQEMGRQVRRGERSIKIIVPHKRKLGEGDDERWIVTGFGIGSVFDISQTDGEPLPTSGKIERIVGSTDIAKAVEERLRGVLQADEVVVVRTNTKPAAGSYHPLRRLIQIDVDLSGDQATKTLIHEAAHHFAHHSGGTQRADAETVAEGAAYVVLNHFGIDSSGYSFGYVAHWAKDKEVVRHNLDGIQRTANALITAIEEAK